MDKKYGLLKDLMVLIDRFEKDAGNNNITIEGFADWMNEELVFQKHNFTSISDELKTNTLPHEAVESEIAQLVILLYKYEKIYLKKVIDLTLLVTIDDFIFLETLYKEISFTKGELINRHLMEITSGSEVIKRLEKNGLIEEFPDRSDKRFKRVKITENGKTLYNKVLTDILKSYKILSAKLSNSEKIQLMLIMRKINANNRMYISDNKDASIDEIIDRFIKPKL